VGPAAANGGSNYFRIAVKPKLSPLNAAAVAHGSSAPTPVLGGTPENAALAERTPNANAPLTQHKQNPVLTYEPIDSPPFAQKVAELISRGKDNVDDVYGLEQGALSNSS